MISVNSLGYAYPKQPNLYSNLNLQVPAGKITGLLGKNGSGKTTLLKILSGLLYPQQGNLEVLGFQPQDRDPGMLQEISFVPEEFHLPSITMMQFVEANGGFYPKFDHTLITELVNNFELPKDKKLQKLSYGQKKKFLISFALATKCQILLLDEPTNGLDIPSKAIFRQVLAGSLQEDQTVIISTHQVRDIETLIDSIVVLDNGKITMQEDMHVIASKLQFSQRTNMDDPDVLYGEMVPGGYKVISTQVNGSSAIDLELLFNAVASGKINFENLIA